MANYVLEILDGDRAGEVLPVGQSALRIGRKSGNDLVLADEKTSGVHCEIAPEGDRLVLKDLGSTNGTFLDGKRITEVVLTPGDVVTVGRLRVQFRDEKPAAAGDDAGEFSLRQIDAARLQKKSSPMGLLLVLLVLVGGGGGAWWWMQQGDAASVGRRAAPQRREVLSVQGNLLAADIASCESDAGWALAGGPIAFRPNGVAHTGRGGLSAFVDLDAVEDSQIEPAGDFGILRLAEPIQVQSGSTLTIAAYCQSSGGGLVGLRAVSFSDQAESPFRFVSGAPIAAQAEWRRIEAVVTVPDGCSRLQLEVVAALPGEDAEVHVDDVSVTAGGDPNGVKVKLDSGHTAFGFGGALAVRSADPQSPAAVVSVVPGAVPPALRGLAAAGQCVLTDVGGAVKVAAAGAGFQIDANDVDALTFVLPADSGEGLMSADDRGLFASTSAASEFQATKVLFGSFGTRGMLQFDAQAGVSGATSNGYFTLTAQGASALLVVGFREERQRAGALVRSAKAAVAEGRLKDALDAAREVFGVWPMDSVELAETQQLRANVLAQQSTAARALEQDFEQAGFFDTRGGYERVVEGVDQLIALYGEDNMEDLAGSVALRERAQQRLQAFDQNTFKAQRERLTALADAFAAASEPRLQKMVQDYIARFLPAQDGGEARDDDGDRD